MQVPGCTRARMERAMNRKLFGLAILVAISVIVIKFWNAPVTEVPVVPLAEITIPQFSTAALAGQRGFNANCATCHGENAAGTDQGPTFLQNIYQPAHHSDFAFKLAVKNGVRAHHWRFGSMVLVSGIADDQINEIVTYIRELQRANGFE